MKNRGSITIRQILPAICVLLAQSLGTEAQTLVPRPRDQVNATAGEPRTAELPAPKVLVAAPGFTPVVLPDGAVEHYFTKGEYGKQSVFRIRSGDEGDHWTEPERVMPLPADRKWAGRSPHPMIDSKGEMHLFLADLTLADQVTWHTKFHQADRRWSKLRMLGNGNGPMTPPIQLQSGRIVEAVAYRLANARWDEPLGRRASTTYYSDDFGDTWQRSPQELRVGNFVDQDYFAGAHEPIAVELKDGRVWMIIRTQIGWLYESYSRDGVSWSEPKPTDFRSSDSPACVVRLPGGELVIFWNNCNRPPPLDGAFIYTGRDALHAAISADEGLSWSGFREVYLDPRRDLPPHKMGDRGASYANAAVTRDGRIIVAAGQRDERVMIRVDPAWLRAKSRDDDFSQGLAGWSVFKAFGPVEYYWRNRRAGAQLVAHPSRPETKCLELRRPDENDGDGAAWNFPGGKSGRVTVRLLLQPGFQGALISLTDRFYFPQEIDPAKAAFVLPISAKGELAGVLTMENNHWYDLALEWQMERSPPRGRWTGECKVMVDGRAIAKLPQLNRAKAGVSYLRLNATGTNPPSPGFLVEKVTASVAP